MPAKVEPEARITRTPLAGGATHVVTERLTDRSRVIRDIQVTNPQSVATPEARLTLRNNLGTFDAWTIGDTIVIEARRGGASDFQTIFRGFIAEPAFQPGLNQENGLTLHCMGFMAVLDLVTISEDVGDLSYPGTQAWTTIAASVLATLCPAWTLAITSDVAAATDTIFPVGMSLRQVLEIVRSGLNQGSAKWEQTLDLASGGGTTAAYTLAPRSAALQATYAREAALPGSMRGAGAIADIINNVVVTGGTSPQYLLDYVRQTSDAGTSFYDLNDPARRIAQGFTALDTPLYSVAAKMARGPIIPSAPLTGKVMRGSDGYNVLTESIRRRFKPVITFTNQSSGIANPTEAQVGPIDDRNPATSVDFATNNILAEIIRMDFPTKATHDGTLLMPSKSQGCGQVLLKVTPPGAGTWRIVIEGSDDGVTWDTFLDQSGSTTAQQAFGFGSGIGGSGTSAMNNNGYKFRVKASSSVSGTMNIFELRIMPYRLDRYTGASSPTHLDILNGNDWVVNANPGTQNPIASFSPMYRLIDGVPQEANRIFMVKFTHQTPAGGTNNTYVRIAWQLFGVGFQYLDLPTPISTPVEESIVFSTDALPSFIDFSLLDTRGSGPALATTISNVRLFEHVENVAGAYSLVPVEPDQVNGSAQSWAQSEMQSTFTDSAVKTYAAPAVGLDSFCDVGIVGGPRTPNDLSSYFFVWIAPTSATAQAYDRMEFNTVAVDDKNPALGSVDGGVNWFVQFSNALMRVRSIFEFNNSPAQATAKDASSYATWANLIPGGVLRASYQDGGVFGPSATQAVANAILKRRGVGVERLVLVVDGDPALRPGRPVRLLSQLAQALGLPAGDVDKDVVSVDHVLGPGTFLTTMRLVEHGFLSDLAYTSLATLTNKRGI